MFPTHTMSMCPGSRFMCPAGNCTHAGRISSSYTWVPWYVFLPTRASSFKYIYWWMHKFHTGYGGMMVWWYLELVVRAASFRQLHVFILVDSRLRNYNIPGRRIHSTTGARSIWKNISSFSMFPHDSQPLRWTIDIYSLAAYMKCLWWHEFVSSINYEY